MKRVPIVRAELLLIRLLARGGGSGVVREVLAQGNSTLIARYEALTVAGVEDKIKKNKKWIASWIPTNIRTKKNQSSKKVLLW
jgi:hypothetical protein